MAVQPGTKYPFCIDLFGWHKKGNRTVRPKRKNLCTISQEEADEINHKLFNNVTQVKKGQKWCAMRGWMALRKLKSTTETTFASTSDDTLDYTNCEQNSEFLYIDEPALDHNINSLCKILNLSINYAPLDRPINLQNKYRANTVTKILQALCSGEKRFLFLLKYAKVVKSQTLIHIVGPRGSIGL